MIIPKKDQELLLEPENKSIATGYNNSEAATLKNSEFPLNEVNVEGKEIIFS